MGEIKWGNKLKYCQLLILIPLFSLQFFPPQNQYLTKKRNRTAFFSFKLVCNLLLKYKKKDSNKVFFNSIECCRRKISLKNSSRELQKLMILVVDKKTPTIAFFGFFGRSWSNCYLQTNHEISSWRPTKRSRGVNWHLGGRSQDSSYGGIQNDFHDQGTPKLIWLSGCLRQLSFRDKDQHPWLF